MDQIPGSNQHDIASKSNWNKSGISGMTGLTSAARSHMRKCPDEEFFNLTLLSIKMKNKKYPQILALKSNELFEKCKKEKGMNFLLFYDWIDKEIAKIKYLIKYKRVQNGN